MKLVSTILCAALCAGAASLDRHAWMRWDAGAWVEHSIQRMDDRSMTKREELLAVSPTSFVVATEFAFDDVDGMEPVRSEKEYGPGFMGQAHLDPEAEELGTETVAIAGRKYACTIWRSKGGFDEADVVDTTWVSGELAQPIRIHHANAQGEMLLELVSLRESIAIGRKRVTCAKYAGRLIAQRGDEEIDQAVEWWFSFDVPGGLVRTVLSMRDEAGELQRHTMQVTDFGAKPESR